MENIVANYGWRAMEEGFAYKSRLASRSARSQAAARDAAYWPHLPARFEALPVRPAKQ
jgi:hypothetical protein